MKPQVKDLDFRNRLILVRGLPGSGKTTLSCLLAGMIDRALGEQGNAEHFTTDEYWKNEDGEYDFQGDKAGQAHAWCESKVRNALKNGVHTAVVHNTFSQRWELEEYFQMADEHGYETFVLETQNFFGSDHPVPDRVFDKMVSRWQSAPEIHRPSHGGE